MHLHTKFTKSRLALAAWMVPVLSACCLQAAQADVQRGLAKETAPDSKEAAASSLTPPTASPDDTISSTPLKVGLDLYNGISNLPGQHRFRDGFWAGSAATFPSVGYVQWDNAQGASARISVGAGKLYNGSNTAIRQPVEAYYQRPIGRLTATVGKYWIPFAQMEWEYETKPGLMLQWEGKASNLVASLNYNQNINTSNAYLRYGRKLGKNTDIGVSLGAGKGLSYDSAHNRALGLDFVHGWRGLRFSGEYFVMQNRSSDRFTFGCAKVSYEKLGRWTPFVHYNAWKDKSEELGRFRSTTFGMDYQLTPLLTIEGAFAATSGKGVSWLELHWMWETGVGGKS